MYGQFDDPVLRSHKELVEITSPDCIPSCGVNLRRVDPKGDGNDYQTILQVKGLGVLVVKGRSRLDDPRGRIEMTGLALFTKDEIGPSPDL